ncbi:hypothetical protein TNCV_1885821 [Trichonephila clavipes]|nr:hypothetical protein TNCV_1885821 [Trichonephila clavipes]
MLQKRKKNQCCSKPEAFLVTSTCADARYLDHTCICLSQYLGEAFEGYNIEEKSNSEIINKWGWGGTQKNLYKQKLENATDWDANIFHNIFGQLRLLTKEGALYRKIQSHPT